ncbi:YkuS family protein [Defluviitalea saccharophila]|uniref:YkuS family protein n=1 Tax=Defluviitalea saccharophila TaxID=879970 RepID=A0ABZ2Y856_9FIRM|nr:YkuS family protein [Candidatus Epulonipiscium sp.]
MKNIGVQKGLSPIKDYLSSKGYNVQEFDTSAENAVQNLGNVDAIVVTGMDQNVMGIQTTSTKVPIIDASGMVPEEVEKSINRMS